ncbi:hypothetical protein PI95_027505 [Hassallia byssoidea VB512170]|uniref:Uncharacterized protein n=2 Tax=Hassallia TaxID=482629 RepID=A0A846HIB8_9CYAN|nr:hypothetical protein [Hassalia byssoidea VB512170]
MVAALKLKSSVKPKNYWVLKSKLLLSYNNDKSPRASREEIVDMSYPKVNDEEITRRGKELYEKSIRTQVETPENIGKIISINVETGEYEIGDDLVVTSLRLRAKQADAAVWAEKIGFNAVYAVGGTLVRTA